MSKLVVDISTLAIDQKYQIGFKLLDITRTFIIQQDTQFEIPIKINYLQMMQVDLKLSIYQKDKNNRKGKEIVSKELDIDTVFYNDINQDIVLTSEECKAQFNLKIKYKFAEKQVVQKFEDCMTFQSLIQAKKQQIQNCQYMQYIAPANNIEQILPNNSNQFQQLSLLDQFFPGMRDDFTNPQQQLEAIELYNSMIKQLDSISQLSRNQVETQAKIIDILECLFEIPDSPLFNKKIVFIFGNQSSQVQKASQILQSSSSIKYIPMLYEDSVSHQQLLATFQCIQLMQKVVNILTTNKQFKILPSNSTPKFEGRFNLKTEFKIEELFQKKTHTKAESSEWQQPEENFGTIPIIQMVYFVTDKDTKYSTFMHAVSDFNKQFTKGINDTSQCMQSGIEILSSVQNILLAKVDPAPLVLYPIPLPSELLNCCQMKVGMSLLENASSVGFQNVALPRKVPITQEQMLTLEVHPLPCTHSLSSLASVVGQSQFWTPKWTAVAQTVVGSYDSENNIEFITQIETYLKSQRISMIKSMCVSGLEVWNNFQIQDTRIKITFDQQTTSQDEYFHFQKLYITNSFSGPRVTYHSLKSELKNSLHIKIQEYQLESDQSEVIPHYEPKFQEFANNQIMQGQQKIRIKINEKCTGEVDGEQFEVDGPVSFQVGSDSVLIGG
ncbi:Conserved_hypothetical protein [Hexamita inflata]|uniref:Uncharacterized protein n=1 Tax=Hexamita inflata TaxID=28002 RepID=A0AA86TTD9_9EUKA|nr:Conserved hypothetical protein [Hexamita inflata]